MIRKKGVLRMVELTFKVKVSEQQKESSVEKEISRIAELIFLLAQATQDNK